MGVFKSAVLLNTDGRGGAQASLTSGFVVSAEARLCPIVLPGPIIDFEGGTSAGLQEVIVRGYLVAGRR